MLQKTMINGYTNKNRPMCSFTQHGTKQWPIK